MEQEQRIQMLEDLLINTLAYHPVCDVAFLFEIILNDKFKGQLHNLEEKKKQAREIVKGIM